MSKEIIIENTFEIKEVLIKEDFKEVFKLPFILKFKYKDIETYEETFKKLFKDLLENNPRFKQLVDLENIKEICIYKNFTKTYSKYLYFNASMNNINYHFYLNNDITKITAITKIVNMI